MNFDSDHWNIAEEQFSLWLKGNKQRNLTITEILKSTYFIFRKEQSDKLTKLCNQAFEIFVEREKRNLRESLLHEPSILYSKTSFERERESDSWKRLTKAKNYEIINGILSGDQKVFNDLYEYEFPKVVRMIKKYSGNIENAKDIFQDSLVILIEKVNRKELDLTCSVKTYLYSISRILWSAQLRKNQLTISLDDEYGNIETDDIFINFDSTLPDVYDDVNKAIEMLGNQCKKLLECFYYKKMSWNEIAITLGYKSAASAKNQKYKYLERIRNTVAYELE
jgi:RNA polymerase sigma factor (sigma-70 family)